MPVNGTPKSSARHLLMLRVLREAALEGVPKGELMEVGGRWWWRILNDLQVEHTIGEENGRLFLVVDVDDGRGGDQARAFAHASAPVGETPAAVVSADTLFPVEHEPRSPYDLDEAA